MLESSGKLKQIKTGLHIKSDFSLAGVQEATSQLSGLRVEMNSDSSWR
jgi:hypothetical protein